MLSQFYEICYVMGVARSSGVFRMGKLLLAVVEEL